MRLMQLVVRCPWPPQSGGDFRAATLADQNVATDFGSLGLAGSTVGDCPAAIQFEPLQSFSGGNPWRAFDRACPTCLALSSATLDEIDSWVDRFRPDTVVLEGVAWGPALTRLKSRGIATVLNMHNIESALYEQQLRAAAWPKRMLRRVTSRRRLAAARAAVRAADRDLSRLADRVWVCSADDANVLHALGGRADDVIVNPIPDEASLDVPIFGARYENPVPVFIGQLCYFPNVKAIVELTREVVPVLAEASDRRRAGGRGPSTDQPGGCSVSRCWDDPVDREPIVVPGHLGHGRIHTAADSPWQWDTAKGSRSVGGRCGCDRHRSSGRRPRFGRRHSLRASRNAWRDGQAAHRVVAKQRCG